MDNYEKINLNEQLMTYLRNISHTMHALYEGKGSQKRILIILNEEKNMTQRALTKRLGIKPSSASEVISKLENAQLITRLPSQIDKRTVDISLTSQGKKLAIEALKKRQKRHDEMFLSLSDNEKKQLLSLLKKVDNDWKKYHQTKNHVHHQK